MKFLVTVLAVALTAGLAAACPPGVVGLQQTTSYRSYSTAYAAPVAAAPSYSYPLVQQAPVALYAVPGAPTTALSIYPAYQPPVLVAPVVGLAAPTYQAPAPQQAPAVPPMPPAPAGYSWQLAPTAPPAAAPPAKQWAPKPPAEQKPAN